MWATEIGRRIEYRVLDLRHAVAALNRVDRAVKQSTLPFNTARLSSVDHVLFKIRGYHLVQVPLFLSHNSLLNNSW